MSETTPKCVFCDATSQEMPLVVLKYQEQDYWICAQHLPVLIHEPSKLVGKLPGAEKMPSRQHE